VTTTNKTTAAFTSYGAPATPAATSRLHAFWLNATRNPRWMLMDTVSRLATARVVVRSLQRSPDLSRYRLADSVLAPLDVDAFVHALERDGFCTGLVLPQHIIGEFLRFADSAYCFASSNPALGFRYRDKEAAQAHAKRVFSLGRYLFMDEVQSVVDGLARDPLLLTIAARYMRAEPVMTGTRLWWTFAASESDYDSSVTTSFFHYDKDDYTALRLFFYLTPVHEGFGPHVVVRGSHSKKRPSQILSLGERKEADIIASYGAENLITIYGEAGYGFAEDPFVFHRATRPVAGDRLLLEIKYAAHDYKIFPLPPRSAIRHIIP
jgi:hypothetical protein